MKLLRIPHLAVAIIMAVILLGIVGCFCFFQMKITDKTLSPQLQIGDRVIVNRLSTLHRGEIVAYKNPLGMTRPSYGLGRCLAMPGDTLWLFAEETDGDSVRRRRNVWHVVVVPSKGKSVRVTRWNKELLSNALFAYEGANVCNQCDTILIVNGEAEREVTFTHDYLWISARGDSTIADSRLFGFLPADYVLGTVSLISYSIREDYSIPLDRIFKNTDY